MVDKNVKLGNENDTNSEKMDEISNAM